MKTQTAEEYLKEKDSLDCFWTESDEDICKVFNEFATTQIEALRERLKETTLPMTINDEPTNLVTMTKGSIDQVINNFLKELSDGK